MLPSNLRVLSCLAFFGLWGISLWGAGAASADLSPTGAAPAQQAALLRVYSTLPHCCRTAQTVNVRLLGDADMDACLQATAAAHAQRLVNAEAVDGFYLNSPKTITLRAPSPTADVSAPFAHEYGHYVWMNVLTAAQRTQYRTIYDTQRTAHHLVSVYAAVSVEEGFAEAFSYYVRDCPCLAKCDALSCDCLSRVFAAPSVP